jgi:hypothetical protein
MWYCLKLPCIEITLSTGYVGLEMYLGLMGALYAEFWWFVLEGGGGRLTLGWM